VQTRTKDADAVKDYLVDWGAKWLAGPAAFDTLAESTFEVEDGLTMDSDAHTSTTATVWLSGGTPGVTYEVTNRIVTAAGRTDDFTFKVQVTD
jgi:hypothetical protein